MNILIKLTKAGNRVGPFDISDNYGNIIGTNISLSDLIAGRTFSIDDNVTVVTLTSTGKCKFIKNISVSVISPFEIPYLEFNWTNTATLWRHLTDPSLYNNYYGNIEPYVIEYPFSYQFNDEIVQNVKDYTKVYNYEKSNNFTFDINNKVQPNEKYFNKALLYNDQQSTGNLNLYPKPLGNMSEYLKYPKYNTDSKDILFTKSDNFYQFNTFWSVTKDPQIPQFVSSCESLSVDKVINNDNMDYSTRSFKKSTLRAKDTKLRLTLDNRSDTKLVTQFIVVPSQVSYK